MEPEEAPPIEEQAIEQPTEEETAPTKSVKNFWERLDEVFNLSSQTNQNLEQILEQFPEVAQINQQFSSALFQPERISLCSNDDIQPSSQIPGVEEQTKPYNPATGHFPSEYFSNFRIRLQRPLRNVKSLQLLSATIPNATTNIPDSQTFFWWYKLRSVAEAIQGPFDLGTVYFPGDIVLYNTNYWVCVIENGTIVPANYWTEVMIGIISSNSPSQWNSATGYNINDQVQYNGKVYICTTGNTNLPPDRIYWKQTTLPADQTRPNYYDLNPYHLYYVYLAPTYFYPNDYLDNKPNYFNRTFRDYQDLVDALNFCMGQPQGNTNAPVDDITFQYSPVLNKIIMVPLATELAADYYYLPCGYEDPNIAAFMQDTGTSAHFTIYFGGPGGTAYAPSDLAFTPQSTLNTRLGFTWNGRFQNVFSVANPWSDPSFFNIFYWYMRKTDPILTAVAGPMITETITANSYGDLVNTSCVRIYADFTFGSTQDSLGSTNSTNVPIREGLLSIVPVNTNNLGVGFYQNNFNNALTKIPKNITEIGIAMLTDQGLPFYLPNSATVLLELAVEYY